MDMRTTGIEIRPLRELTGHSLFNEVYLTNVFVPDDSVVGAINSGWLLARTTLANERIAMGRGASFGGGIEDSWPWPQTFHPTASSRWPGITWVR